MEKIFNFYTLSASSDVQNIRYVGVTVKTVNKRFYHHKYCATNPSKRGLPVHKWMYAHYLKGEDIIVTLIDSCNESEWEEREKYWISFYKEKGFNLLNISEGGKGVITKEMRDTDSITRSIEAHEKAIVALHKDGTFYKEFKSAAIAIKELNIKSKTAISNALNGRSKSCAGFLWVYKENYDTTNEYSYKPDNNRKPVYQFDLKGNLIKEYPFIRYFKNLEGWSTNGIRNAISNKLVYHDCYWSLEPTININEYESYYKYQEVTSSGIIVRKYRTLKDITNYHNLQQSAISSKIRKNIAFPNGNFISKL